ncbi:MAG: hypothetical protein CM15mP58_18730 [Burkholderiaceae bacterium]|nr:MAG: hypothetical protein CM15mP58_18730 [Burkholderiaceae bacterium]
MTLTVIGLKLRIDNVDVKAIKAFLNSYQSLKQEIAKVIVGQDKVIEQILISISQVDTFCYRSTGLG